MTQNNFFAGILGVTTPPHRGVDTSRAAAKKIAPSWTGIKLMCLQEIVAAGPVNVLEQTSSGGMTADEIADKLRVSILSIRPAVTTLANAGVVMDSGARRYNSRNNQTIVWVRVTT